MEELLKYCSQATGYERQAVEAVIGSFLDKIAQELSEGHSVDLGKNFGTFSVKLRTGHEAIQKNSPRTPKESRYRIIFRENNGLKKRMKL